MPLHACRAAAQPDIPVFLPVIRNAVTHNRKLVIRYQSLQEERTARTVWPLGLTLFGHLWLLSAWCETRADFREFRVDRIETLDLLKEHFTPSPERSFARYMAKYL